VRERRGVEPLGDGGLSTTTVIVDGASVRYEHRGANGGRRGEVRVTSTRVARGGVDLAFELPPTAPAPAARRIELRRRKLVAEAWTIDGRGSRVQRGVVAPSDDAIAALLASLVQAEVAMRLGLRRHPLGWYSLDPVAIRVPTDLLAEGTHVVTLEAEVRGESKVQSQALGPVEDGAHPLVERIARPFLAGDVPDERVEIEGLERRAHRVVCRHPNGAPEVVEERVAHAREARPAPRFAVELGGTPRFAQHDRRPTGASGAPMTFIGLVEPRCATPGWLLLFADLAGGEVVQLHQLT
jgi:hypothetical protein